MIRRQPRFVDTPPGIFLVGITTLIETGVDAYLKASGQDWHYPDQEWWMPAGHNDFTAEQVGELAGRSCYRSLHNPAGRSTEEYLADQIVGRAHGSVLEHLSVNLMCRDVPRSTQLEIVRHRAGAAYSWESTRFTDDDPRFIVPPLLRGDSGRRAAFEESCRQAWDTYGAVLLTLGAEPELTRKQRKEAARSLLPGAYGSDGMVTLNARALRHVIAMRTDPGADASIREWALAVYRVVAPVLPGVFTDAAEDPDGAVRFTHGKV